MAIYGGVYQIAAALWREHDFDPDVAVLAAHCFVTGQFPTASWAQAFYHLRRVKHWPKLILVEVEEIEQAYLEAKIPNAP